MQAPAPTAFSPVGLVSPEEEVRDKVTTQDRLSRLGRLRVFEFEGGTIIMELNWKSELYPPALNNRRQGVTDSARSKTGQYQLIPDQPQMTSSRRLSISNTVTQHVPIHS
jgi:hypothetical protein